MLQDVTALISHVSFETEYNAVHLANYTILGGGGRPIQIARCELEHSENKIILLSELFENEIGP